MSNNLRYGVSYFAPLSFSTGAPFSGTLTEPGFGSASFRITGTYFLAATGTVDGIVYRDFLFELGGRLEDNSPNGGIYSAYFDPANGRVFVVNGSGDNWNLRISGTYAARVFGTTHNALMTTASFSDAAGVAYTVAISGNNSPWGVWKSQYRERTEWKQDYEPEPFYFDHEADDGQSYSIGRNASAIYSDWKHKFELQSHVRKELATVGEPYTWQNFLEDVRTIKPFFILTSSTGQPSLGAAQHVSASVYERLAKFRAEGSNFKPETQDANQQRWHHIQFLTRKLPTGSFR